MPEQSSYLDYLPATLWQQEYAEQNAQPSLGAVLRIFEKVLTGIADTVPLAHGEHTHPAITDEIDRVHRHLDPWTTPSGFLEWLASCVGLEFPTLRGSDLWNEYQRRTAISEIARIYRMRGRKSGLIAYLELFAATRTRVAIDDGTRLLEVRPRPGWLAEVSGLVTQGPQVNGSTVRWEGLTRPCCAAAAGDGSLFVGDIGLPDGLPVQLRSRVWRLDPTGRVELAGAPPRPRPVAADTLPLSRVVGVAVAPPRGGAPETLFVLDRAGQLYSVPAPFPAASLLTTLSGGAATLAPVAVAVDPANGNVLVLDRGAGAGATAAPRIFTVQPAPLSVTSTPLRSVVEPLSMTVEPDGALLVGDGGVQAATAPANAAGNVVRIVRNAPTWAETRLLPAANPLVAPTGLARTRDGQLYVLDAGLRPFAPPVAFPYICVAAEHAAVFRIDPGAVPAAVRVTSPGRFVYPTGLVGTGGLLVVCDPGQPANGWPLVRPELKLSRVQPFQFDVIVHFVQRMMPADQQGRQQVARQVLGNIRAVVEREKPAHTRVNLISS